MQQKKPDVNSHLGAWSMEKRKRGRPKKNQRKIQSKNQQQQAQQPEQNPEVIPPQKAGLVETVKELAGNLFRNQPVTLEANLNPNPENQQPPALPSGNSSEGAFDATAKEALEKYGDGSAADSGGSAGGVDAADVESAGQPEQQTVTPSGHFIAPETVEGFLVMVTDAMSKQHGEHWRLSKNEKVMLVPANVAMIDEQGPKLFGKLDNPAFWAWTVIMSGWIATKSESVGKVVSSGIEKIISMMGAK